LASSQWPGYAAFGLGIPYPALKWYWSLGGGVVRPGGYHEGVPYGETLALVIGAVGSLALVQRWGTRLPRRLVLIPGWTGAAVLVTTGALAVFGTVGAQVGLVESRAGRTGAGLGMVTVVYGSWLLFGLCVAVACMGYQQRTRPACAACGSSDGQRSMLGTC